MFYWEYIFLKLVHALEGLPMGSVVPRMVKIVVFCWQVSCLHKANSLSVSCQEVCYMLCTRLMKLSQEMRCPVCVVFESSTNLYSPIPFD